MQPTFLHIYSHLRMHTEAGCDLAALQMTNLYNRLMSQAYGKAKKQSHILGLLMGYSQMSIFAVYAGIIYFGSLVSCSMPLSCVYFLVGCILMSAIAVDSLQQLDDA